MIIKDKPSQEREFSCTFCGPGTWALWEVVTDDGVVFVCDRHHVEMSEAKIIRLERRMGEDNWKYVDDFNIFKNINLYE